MHPQSLNTGLVYGSGCSAECPSDVLFWGFHFLKMVWDYYYCVILCVLDEILILKTQFNALLRYIENALLPTGSLHF